jgi:hypothetical protein
MDAEEAGELVVVELPERCEVAGEDAQEVVGGAGEGVRRQ